jgi:hypothetical protein
MVNNLIWWSWLETKKDLEEFWILGDHYSSKSSSFHNEEKLIGKIKGDFDGEIHSCDVFIFDSMWFELCFQIIVDITLVHIWISEYIFFGFAIWFL